MLHLYRLIPAIVCGNAHTTLDPKLQFTMPPSYAANPLCTWRLQTHEHAERTGRASSRAASKAFLINNFILE